MLHPDLRTRRVILPHLAVAILRLQVPRLDFLSQTWALQRELRSYLRLEVLLLALLLGRASGHRTMDRRLVDRFMPNKCIREDLALLHLSFSCVDSPRSDIRSFNRLRET